jgi:predicted metalloendopeptidase
MDTTVDPCEVDLIIEINFLFNFLQDFYQFACGNWDKSHPIPEGRNVRSSFESFVNDVVDLYRGI